MLGKKVIYYVDNKGWSPVLQTIRRLPLPIMQKVAAYISLLEEQAQTLGQPMGEEIGGNLYEVRPDNNQILYFFKLEGSLVILHFIDLETEIRSGEYEKGIAMKRMKEFLDRYKRGEIALKETP